MRTPKMTKSQIEAVANRIAISTLDNWSESQREGSEPSDLVIPPAGWAACCAEQHLVGEDMDDKTAARVVALVVKYTR